MKRNARMTFLLCLLVALGSTAGCTLFQRPRVQSYAPTLPSTELKTGLRAHFFGTTTLLFTDGTTSIMVDGFLSRPGVAELVLGTEPNKDRIGYALGKAGVEKIDYVLVAHSHHDHAMDAPTIAKEKQAMLVGSKSTWNIAPAMDLDVKLKRIIIDREPLPAGTFTVTSFYQDKHAPTLKVLEWLLDGDIEKPLRYPARVWNYKFGGNYTFLLEHQTSKTSILVVPSAKTGLGLEGKKADVVFLSIGNLDRQSDKKVRKYWKEAVVDTGAKLVIPVHWDSFFKSLEQPLVAVPAFFDDTGCAMETLTYLARRDKVEISFMPLFKPVLLSGVEKLKPPPKPSGIGVAARDPFKEGCRAGRETIRSPSATDAPD
jgi:L-ascorbate metabolism protein UlaG (beta-lactamase superfamily)